MRTLFCQRLHGVKTISQEPMENDASGFTQSFMMHLGIPNPIGGLSLSWQKKMGLTGFDWQNSNDVLEEGARFSRGNRKDFHMVHVDARAKKITLHERIRQLGSTGIQAPVFRFDGKLKGSVRLHDTSTKLPYHGAEQGNIFTKSTTAFKTHTGKLNLLLSPWSLFSDYWEWLRPKADELWAQ